MKWQDAKRIPLTEVLARLGYAPQDTSAGGRQVWYASPFRQETKPSFNVNVDKNIWHDLGLGAGGSVIDFALRYYAVSSVSEALSRLDELGLSPRYDTRTPSMFDTPPQAGTVPASSPAPSVDRGDRERRSGIQIKKVQPLRNPALVQYLESRAIPRTVAAPFLQEAYYTVAGRDRTYFALAFPNESGGYELRNKYFQGVAGAKAISLLLPDTPDRFEVMIFEGFMDFLSAQALWNRPNTSALILNSVALKDKAIAAVREHGLSHVRLYLDHDDSGRKLTRAFQALEGLTVVDASGVYEGHKDFNAYLMARQPHGASPLERC